jgi:hypothetical protein
MAKTVVEKVNSPNPDVSIFKISGVLGYHENAVLTKFFGGCVKKSMTRLIMDFSELGSLGGGCAKIIREAATAGEVVVCIVGASKTVRNFLEKAGKTPIIYESDQDSALHKIGAAQPQPAKVPRDKPSASPAEATESEAAPRETTKKKHSHGERSPREHGPARTRTKQERTEAVEAAAALDNGENVEDAKRSVSAPPAAKLERRLLRYRSLFSLSSDFGQIREKSRLLDAFLLTTISQAGIESAAFLERTDESFCLTAWKGFETADPGAFTVDLDDVDHKEWVKLPRVRETNESPISDVARKRIVDWGMPYIAPFIIHGKLEGLVILGNPIREGFGEAVCEFMMMLIDQTAIAYRNSQQLEQENQRTLGIVRSLMSMIGDHTLSRGDMEPIVNYVHAVAEAMHYPEERIKDLIHGTMLRDVGMIKVSDLIVQNERELKEEEWAAIKRHPVEGADMLRSMSFSEDTCNIVLFHHERFNGGGYPQGVRGTEIPLGARIVSVVESYAVMLQKRPTRPALSSEQSLSTLNENLGKRYDPDVVAAFVEIVEEEIRTGRKTRYKNGELLGAKG